MLKKVFFLTLVLIPLTLGLYVLKSFTKLKTLEIKGGNTCINQSEVYKKNKILNQNLFILSEELLEEKIKEEFPCTTAVKVTKDFPSTIIVNVQTSEVIVEISDKPFSLTSEGLVTKSQSGNNLPKLFLPQEVTVEENKKIGSEKVLFALRLLKGLLKSDFTPTQVRFIDDIDIIVYSQTEAKAIFTTTKDPNVQVDSLQSVLAKAKIDASKISQIDLRFNKPVITYNK